MSSTRITNLLIIIVSCLIAFAGLELIIRQLDVMKTKMGITKGYSQLYSDERTTADYVFGHHPNVSVVLSNENMEIKFTTNSEGLRERKNYNLLDNSIIFLGDSVIEGMVDDGETIDEHFEALSNITSLNYGLGSSNTIHEYLYLKGKY